MYHNAQQCAICGVKIGNYAKILIKQFENEVGFLRKNDREELILSILEEKKYISVTELSEITFTSASSIRRDLANLEKRMLVKRSYGGVTLMDNIMNVPLFNSRINKNMVYKKIAAKKAAHLIKDNMSVMLDSSSTVLFVLPYLKEHKNILIFTNNLYTLKKSKEMGLETYCIGGKMNEDSTVFTGCFAEEMIKQINPDILFFSSQAIDSDGNISDSTETENHIRKIMIEQARTSVFLYDTDKINQKALYHLCNVNDIDYSFHN